MTTKEKPRKPYDDFSSLCFFRLSHEFAVVPRDGLVNRKSQNQQLCMYPENSQAKGT